MIQRTNKAVKDSRQLTITKVIVFVLFAIYAASLIFPFLWMVYNAGKTNAEFYANVWGWPENWNNIWVNLNTALTMKIGKSTILTMTLRSLYLAAGGTVLSLLSSSCAAYVIARYKFPGRNLIYLVAISIMLIPTIGSTSTTYRLLGDLNLLDSPIGLLLLYSGGFGFQFLLLHSAFRSISPAYAEAAQIDGAGHWTVFTRVMVPMILPTIAPLAVLDFINLWNDYFSPYLYMKSRPTLAVGLQFMVSQMQYDANWPALFALMLFSIIPVLLLFIVFQKQIMSNVSAGGLKG
jgi:ABC-type glycerol-3-phosphate transport system permease component